MPNNSFFEAANRDPETDIEKVEWLVSQLEWYKNDLVYKAPELFGGVASYMTIFMASLPGQVKTTAELLARAKNMTNASPWHDKPERAEQWMKDTLPGWRGAVEWAEALFALTVRSRP